MFMTWNCRIIHHDKDENPYFAIHEVFYDEHGEVANWTTNPIDVSGKSQMEVTKALKQMLEDITKTEMLLESQLYKVVHGIL
jgi:hypothetical protein